MQYQRLGFVVSATLTLTPLVCAQPTINSSGIVNATGYQNKLAPDTVFVVFGAGMGPATIALASAPNYPASLAGTSITFTPAAGGAPISAKIVYSLDRQVAGLLPSSITPGAYAVQVTYNGQSSAPQNVTVVARSFGIATANSAGNGTAQATIGNVNGGLSLTRLTSGSVAFGGYTWTLTPAHPGDTLVLWGTGGGADPANDTGGTSGDQTAAGNFAVLVAGRRVTPLYAGASSGYPGLWQVNFTLPADIAPDCFALVQVSAGSELSNAVSVPIAAAGQAACSDPALSAEFLAKIDAGGAITIGGFGISRLTNTFVTAASSGGPAAATTITASQESFAGAVTRFSAAGLAALIELPRIGPCAINDVTAPNGQYPGAVLGYLNAGATLPASGPGLAPSAALGVISPGPIYDLLLANGTIVNGGRYTLTGNGGPDVAPFTGSVMFPSSFAVTNWDAITTIDRTQPLVIHWTGGDDQVYIIISSSRVVGKDQSNVNIIHNVAITCEVPAAPGSFSVPAAALSYLLPEGIDQASLATGAGILGVEAVNFSSFTMPLVGGGNADYAGISAVLGVSKNLVIQ